MGTPSFTWEGPLSPHIVAAQLKKALFGPLAEQATQEALRAEVLRVALWEQSVLSQPRAITDAQISTQRILSRARSLWEPLAVSRPLTSTSSELTIEFLSDDELSRLTLDSLAEQGDLLSFPQGRWLPAPLRLVSITSELYLLAGGIPSSLLARPVLQKLHLHGSFRQIDASSLSAYPPFDDGNGRWQFQTQESWLGAPASELAYLLQQFHEIELLPVIQQASPQDIEIYISPIAGPQGLRWRSPERTYTNGRYLLRSQTPWGQRFYTIGQIENRQITRQSHVLEDWDIRRLCYALDSEARTPTKAVWDRSQGILKLFSELPARERKRLAVLGLIQENRTSYYPRIWHISPLHDQEVREMLAQLHITVQ